jgi:hypothetical protein
MIKVERFGFIFAIAGVVFFGFAFVVMAVAPWAMLRKVPVADLTELSKDPPREFFELATQYPAEFRAAFGEPSPQSFAKALKMGRDIYVAEACWHCHSQFIRPVSKEEQRFGKVAAPNEYQNVLQMPVLFGTRRVGPDLSRVGGKYSNDWHVAHFYEPMNVVPTSVMPAYRWFFDKNKRPNAKGLAIISYVQWLGTWPQRNDRFWETIYNAPLLEKPAPTPPATSPEPAPAQGASQ